MNIRRLEYFLTLAHTGNMHKASELLNISPPALSKAMKVLEEELETNLWIRDGRRIILTDTGRTLLKNTPAFIEQMKTLKRNLTETDSGPKPVRIGTFEVFSTYFLRFLNELKWDHHSLEMHELLPGEVEKYVASGEVDIGITYMPVPHPDLDFLKVTSIEMGVFTLHNAFRNVPQQELPYVVPVTPLQGVPTKMRGLDGWPEDAYERKILHRVTLLESALELCRQGRVAGYFPVFIVNEHNQRVNEKFRLERKQTPYKGRVCRADVFLVKRKSTVESDLFKQIGKSLRLICQSSS